jgi:DNA-directed RNA polymerase subunit RPC12/RpoP
LFRLDEGGSMTYKTVVDERLAKIASEINGKPPMFRSGDKYMCDDCWNIVWAKHHPKRCPECGSKHMLRVERPGNDVKIVHRPPTGRCSSCAYCTIPPKSKWSSQIGVCHLDSRVVSLNDGCKRRGIGKATKMSFGRRPDGYKGLVLAVNDDHVWEGVLEKDAVLRNLLTPKKAQKKAKKVEIWD